MGKINLLAVSNCRDLGGIKNKKGWILQENYFIRSNALTILTMKDRKKLKNEHKLELVIDLRTYVEMLKKPDRMIPNVHYEHISILDFGILGISHEKSPLKTINQLPEMTNLYRQMISDPFCIEQFKKVLELIFQERTGSVLWHCTEGKDRCGLVSALVLAIFDVSKEEIIKDYEKTNEAASFNELKALLPMAFLPKEKTDRVKALFKADRAYLEAAFDEIDRQYGSLKAFLETLGFDEGRCYSLQEKYMKKDSI